METLVIRKPDDFHIHLREGELFCRVLPFTAQVFARALVMPNLSEPLVNTVKVKEYFREVDKYCQRHGFKDFRALRTLYLTDDTRASEIAWSQVWENVLAAKLYPKGVTTGSAKGVSDVKRLGPVFEEMEKRGMVLSIHAEMPEIHSDYAEWEFFRGPFWWIYQNFPRLKIVWEHITTADMIGLLERYPDRVAGTITAHHLWLTRDDVYGNPHNYCKPPAKSEEDMIALLNAATSGNPKFFFGSDSAPHWKWQKERAKAKAGVFSAPVAMPLLAQIFEELGALHRLEDFTSRFGAEFYGLPLNGGKLVLKKEPWKVPLAYTRDLDGEATEPLVPFLAGETLDWQVIK